MSFLHPLFLLGLLAVAIPVLLHLARRRTRSEQPWSSLRFLRAAPPRLERRRRIEHWLLLALRALAVVLLAGAFARPFFARTLPARPAAMGSRQVLLLDVSASMRRRGLWPEALARARARLRSLGPDDRLAILAFDGRVHVPLGFEQWAATPAARRLALAEARLAALAPGWGETDLGAALVAAAEAVVDDQTATAVPVREQLVVLLSDLTSGARLTALGPADWPAGVRLRIERLPASPLNLGLQLVPAALDGPPGNAAGDPAVARAAERPRVRVLQGRQDHGDQGDQGDQGAATLSASLRWEEGGPATVVKLTPGLDPVLEAPPRPAGSEAGTLLLDGDDQPFDNRLAVAPASPVRSRIVYLGPDVTDASEAPGAAVSSLYFLRRAFPRTRARAAEVVALRPGDPALPAAITGADLVVLTGAPPAAALPALRAYLARGRVVLFAPADAGAGVGLGALLGAGAGSGAPGAVVLREAPAGREVVLTEVDTTHPLLAAFADGPAGDFTRVRFWKRRLVDPAALPGARVLARFDDGSPAWLAASVGRGLVFVMTSGWSTSDSQLALSSKLIPLLWSLLEASTGAASPQAQFLVGEPLPLPPALDEAGRPVARRLRRPDGREVTLAPEATSYGETDRPGLYRLSGPGGPAVGRVFAVNLSPAESAVTPLPLELLDRAGIPSEEAGVAGGTPTRPTGAAVSPASDEQRERAGQAAFFVELEGRQRPWRWVLLAGLVLLLGETLLATRAARRAEPGGGAPVAAPAAAAREGRA